MAEARHKVPRKFLISTGTRADEFPQSEAPVADTRFQLICDSGPLMLHSKRSGVVLDS
jgi:hypothetical protein